MGYRDAAPDGKKDRDGRSVLVLPQGTSLAGKYQTSYLGVGGMSIVYKGYREGKTYFLKEVDAHNSQLVISLSQEKFMLERLNHPGIVKIHDFFEQEGFCYLVMDYIDGKSLNRLISPLPDVFIQEKIVLDWARQLYDIFEYLHNQKPPIIYRDLKPQNVIRDKDGKIFLVDFGIARTFKEDSIGDTTPMGSFLTASPEHYGGKQTDERSDIYTLGATLHYLLTNGKGRGTDLFDFSPPRNINPKISEKTERIIMKALSPDPAKRFASIDEMRKAQFNSVGSEMIVETHAAAEDTATLKRNGKPAGEGISAKKDQAESENVFQSFMNFALSQPRLISVFIGILILITASAVVLKGSTRQKAVAVSSPEVISSPVLAPSQDSAAMTGSSPEPGASPSESPLVPAPGYTMIIGSSEPTGKATPTVAIVTPSVIVPSVASQPVYPVGMASPRRNTTQTPQTAPTPEQTVASNVKPLQMSQTREEMIAELLSCKKDTVRLFSKGDRIFQNNENYFSIHVPPGYYLVKESLPITFASIDENKGPSSLRLLQISKLKIPQNVDNVQGIFDAWIYSKVASGDEILDQGQIHLGGNRTYGYYLLYKGNPPPPITRKPNTFYVNRDLYVQGSGSMNNWVYNFRASGPEETFYNYLESEFRPYQDSIFFTAPEPRIN